MKPFAMGLLSLFISVSAFAETPAAFTALTSISCEQENGDQWYEVGLLPFENKNGYLMAVVLHDDNDQSSRLVLETPVQQVEGKNTLVFENARSTVRLVVTYNNTRLSKGTLTILKDGPGGLTQELSCYKQGRITYDRISKPQPRISVGS
ncbi:hypothetical protein [Bdellovibrio bacteriovorus]|uniref:hypothetical protein n=1 Tax=Bdellovibrio bacteriovorus TaxID=959 RepID=UPI0035A93592